MTPLGGVLDEVNSKFFEKSMDQSLDWEPWLALRVFLLASSARTAVAQLSRAVDAVLGWYQQ